MSAQLILVVPPPLAGGLGEAFLEALDAVLEGEAVASLLLRTAGLEGAARARAAAALAPVVQTRGVAFLVEDSWDAAAAADWDGVHLNRPADYRAARRCLGAGRIVGVSCGTSRHDAMTVAEAGADYVAFGAFAGEGEAAEADLLTWWQELMTPPCVGLGARNAEEARRLAAAGADFVALDRSSWESPAAAVAEIGEIVAALAAAEA